MILVVLMLGSGVQAAMIGELPMVVIPRGEEMEKLHTNFDEGEWKKAATIVLAGHGKADHGAGMETVAKVFCTEKHLYIGWRCEEPDMANLVTKKEGGKIWNHDSVELFIEPRESLAGRTYHHVIVDAGGGALFERGHVYPRYFQLRAFEEKWEPQVEVKVEKKNTSMYIDKPSWIKTDTGKMGWWTCVMRIPLSDLHVGEDAKNGGLWRLNVCRSRPARNVTVPPSGDMFWSWSNLAGGGFQSPARFGYAIPAVFAKNDLEQRVAKLDAAAPRNEDAVEAGAEAKVDDLIAAYWEKPELLKEIQAVAYRGNLSYAMVVKKVSEAIAARVHYAAARDLLYQIERDRPDLDPPPTEVTDRIARFEPFTQGTMGYRLFKPTMKEGDDRAGYPLVIFLHGSAERGGDNQRQLHGGVFEYAFDSVQNKYPCFVMAPQCGMTGGWADMKTNPESRAALQGTGNYRMAEKPGEMTVLLMEAIDAVVAKNPTIDRNCIYLVGSSMGGYGTWELLMRRPTFFAAGIVLCGAGDETRAALVKDVPIWNFHGALDANVRPEASRTMKAAMEKIGGKAKFTEYPDRGHAIGVPNLEEETLAWMFGQWRKN